MQIRKQNTSQIINAAAERLQSDVDLMSAKRNAAINVFDATTKNLKSINASLAASAERCRSLAEVAMRKAEEADRMIEDNEMVCRKIYEIIGKPCESEAA